MELLARHRYQALEKPLVSPLDADAVSDNDISDEQLAKEIALTKARLAVLYEMKKARKRADRKPRAVTTAATRERNLEIRRLHREEKRTHRQLAAQFALSHHTIKDIIAQMDNDDRMAPLREEWRRAREARPAVR